MIQAIVWALVPTSGAGMSESGPMMPSSSVANRRVSASSSFELIVEGSQVTPPFAPPNGTSTKAHFQVIHIASARTSSRSVAGWKSKAALGRSAGNVVLDAVALEYADRAVVALHREVHGVLAMGDSQDRGDIRLEPEMVGGCVELGQCRVQSMRSC